MKKTISILTLVLLLAGCAVETRIVDAGGADPTRYGADLSECKRFASQYEPQKSVDRASMAIGGAVLGMAIGASSQPFGVFSKQAFDGAAIGGAIGHVAGVAASHNTDPNPMVSQAVEPIVVECMQRKGYATIDGKHAPANLNPLSYVPSAVRRPAAAMAPAPAPTTSVSYLQTVGQAGAAHAPGPVGRPPAQAAAPQPVLAYGAGRNKDLAERYAQQRSCSLPVLPWPEGMAAGVETYSTRCSNGNKVYIRCEKNKCKAVAGP